MSDKPSPEPHELPGQEPVKGAESQPADDQGNALQVGVGLASLALKRVARLAGMAARSGAEVLGRTAKKVSERTQELVVDFGRSYRAQIGIPEDSQERAEAIVAPTAEAAPRSASVADAPPAKKPRARRAASAKPAAPAEDKPAARKPPSSRATRAKKPAPAAPEAKAEVPGAKPARRRRAPEASAPPEAAPDTPRSTSRRKPGERAPTVH